MQRNKRMSGATECNKQLLRKLSSRRPVLNRWLFEVEPFVRHEVPAIDDVAEDRRLRSALKKVVTGIDAPQTLVDSIRKAIRE